MMALLDLVPIVLYDNRCYLCSKFAHVVNLLSRGKFSLVGHYTDLGKELRVQFLDSAALEMFWFIDGDTAYGGRAALLPMISAMLSTMPRKSQMPSSAESCDVGCKTAKAVFVRSASLLTHSKKISIS